MIRYVVMVYGGLLVFLILYAVVCDVVRFVTRKKEWHKHSSGIRYRVAPFPEDK